MQLADNCIFCKIIAGQIPGNKVYEDDLVLAINDINPVAPHHYLIIPKVHKESLNAFEASEADLLGQMLFTVKKLAYDLGFHEAGYKTVINTGAEGGQTVFHIHVHVVSGKRFNWPHGS